MQMSTVNYVKSHITNLEKAPDQVLKFLIYNQAKEIDELKRQLAELKDKHEYATIYLEKTGTGVCHYCNFWDDVDVMQSSSCVFCPYYCCKKCMKKNGFYYSKCPECEAYSCKNHSRGEDQLCRICEDSTDDESSCENHSTGSTLQNL